MMIISYYYYYINLPVNSIPVARLIFDRIWARETGREMKKKIFIFFFVSKRDARAVVNLVFICIAIGERLWRQPSTWTANTLRRRTGDITRPIVLLLFLSFNVGGGLSPVRINILLLIPTLFLYNVLPTYWQRES